MDRAPDSPDPAAGPPLAGKSVALVHEWFAATGGSENVFVAISELVPHATGYVLWRDGDAHRGAPFRQSWLARTPLRHAKPLALPVMPIVWRTLTRERFDVVVSSSHAFAHTVKLGPAADTRYLSYVHSPARYIWSPDYDRRGSNPVLTLPRKAIQLADVRLSRHVHSYAANSVEVQARIRRFWHRDARVINPPVDVGFFGAVPASGSNRDYLLGVGRWIRYKNFDLVIDIADRARLPLVIAGSGPEEATLRRLAASARVPVTIEYQPGLDRLRELYRGARALLFPVHEDFGIIPVEAQACGTPVVGLHSGGLRETVVHGETGFLLDSLDPARYAAVLGEVDTLDRARIAAHARAYSTEAFRARMATWLAEEAG